MNNKFSFLTTEFNKKKEEKIENNSNSFLLEKNEVNLNNKGRRRDPDYKTVGIQLPISLHKRARKILLINDSDQNFSELMTDLLEKWVSEKEK